MPRLAHSAMSRLAAVAVALVMSGAAQYLEAPEHHEGHRCQCPVRNGVHGCDCPLCHQEAAKLSTQAVDDPSLPPCHRALAAKRRAEASETAQRQAATGHCLTASCGSADGKVLPMPAAERFVAPGGWALVVIEQDEAVLPKHDAPSSLLREPETPPPRGA